MNYVILHGTPTNIEKGEICDGAIYEVLLEGERGGWDYRKSFTENAKDVLELGNYYDEEDDGIGANGTWTDERRQLVHDRWLELIDILDKQVAEKGRFDLELINYFADYGDHSYKEILEEKIKRFLEDVENDKADASSIVEILDTLEAY